MNPEPTKQFTIDDLVTWTHVASKGCGFRFSTRRGRIIEITEHTVCVKMRNGRLARIFKEKIRKEGEQTALTEAFLQMGRASDLASSQPAEPSEAA